MLIYILSILVIATVARSTDDKPVERRERVMPVVKSSSLEEKIAAFMESGVEKDVNTDHYKKEKIISFAESLIGTPHVMGGYSSSGVDCSGLVKLAHAKSDVELPRSSHDQAKYGTIVSAGDELRRGDIVFFHSTYKKNHLITHTGIYLGDNKFIHASSSRGVTISTLFDSGYYQKHYLFATRLAGDR